jgi:hypothetical protein
LLGFTLAIGFFGEKASLGHEKKGVARKKHRREKISFRGFPLLNPGFSLFGRTESNGFLLA